jgi:hypothetical protein
MSRPIPSGWLLWSITARQLAGEAADLAPHSPGMPLTEISGSST